MRWSTVSFGKHSGRSLPEIILADADWVFWAVSNGVFKGRLADQAEDIARKARAIKIPKPDPERWQVEYRYDDRHGFCGFGFVAADVPSYCMSRWLRRSPYLDLSCVRRGRPYDKRGCRYLLRDFRHHYFGDNTRVTKQRAEEFFSDKRNFVRGNKTVGRKSLS